MKITLGFSPCPNDTFMFAALIHHWIDTGDLEFTVHLEDVEQLNTWASSSFLDVTKMSFHRALSLDNAYTLLRSGAALGVGCGPLLIARHELSENEIKKGPIALPGEWTTAHLLFKLFYPATINKEFHVFSDIEDLVLDEKVVAGVIIHENRFTYQSKGLVCITDLGTAWETRTNLPIPLGGIFAHRRLPVEVIEEVERLIRESIQFAYQNQDMVMPYVRRFAQEMQEEVMLEHIKLYVNDFSLDLGEKGLQAIDSLKNLRCSQ